MMEQSSIYPEYLYNLSLLQSPGNDLPAHIVQKAMEDPNKNVRDEARVSYYSLKSRLEKVHSDI